MLIFFIGAGFVEKYKPRCGHETGLVLIIGVVFSIVYYACVGYTSRHVFKFSYGIFFDFFLPPVIMNSGYNMRRKKFFENLGNVMIFGLGVTFVSFILYSIMTHLFIRFDLLTMTNYVNIGDKWAETSKTVKINPLPLLLFTSLLCSSDVVAAVSIVSYSEQPKLYSCIFGEGVLNDIVSIILFNTIYGL
jgi:NhaP-type Na+/H+ or K+/H+ antiporter